MRPVRRFTSPKPRLGLSAATRPASLVGCPTSLVDPLTTSVCIVESGNSRVHRPALVEDLAGRCLTNSSHADRGVEEGVEAILLSWFRGASRRMTLRRVPLTVGREPPAAALGVVAQTIRSSSVPRVSDERSKQDLWCVGPSRQA